MLSRKSTISFIIPTYNASAFLRRCLVIIRNQDFPQDEVEILLLDGGSSDSTLKIAEEYSCIVIKNEKRLAEYGIQLGIKKASSEYVTIFAADNELIGKNWLSNVLGVFYKYNDISAVWGRIASGRDDSRLNKYFELIQNDPLTWFVNNNLRKYKKKALIYKKECYIFNVRPARPLVWGANGLTFRKDRISAIWDRDSYLGDNDAFQEMIESGNNRVAYFNRPFVYHHHVTGFKEWQSKWSRNFSQHLLDNLRTRNMNWLFDGYFKFKLLLWIFYSLLPIFSFVDSLRLMVATRNKYWLFHSQACFLQAFTYLKIIILKNKWKELLAILFYKRNHTSS